MAAWVFQALQNVAEKDEFLRARITSEIKDEMKRSWRYEIDPVVGLHVKDFLKKSGEKESFIYS